MPSLHQRIGNFGESLALSYLETKGYRLETQQWHSRYGELDLVMWDQQELVFVEVKYKKDHHILHPEEAVDWRKAQKIKKTATAFLNRHFVEPNFFWRFDIVAITGDTQSHQVFHLEDYLRD